MKRRAPSFDSVARIYRFAEYLALGPLLQRTRTHFLAHLDTCSQALLLGDGDGRFLEALLRRNRRLQATAVDSSAAMLTLLRNRCAWATNRVTTHCTSLLDITPSQSTDIVITHFVLDCFAQQDLDRLAQHLATTTQPGTFWLVSDFGPPTNALFRPFATLYVRALYLAFAALTGLQVRTLPDPQKALKNAGFECLARHQRLDGFLYSELWRNNARPTGNIHLSMSETASTHPPYDAQPDPEPAVPSLSEPDPGVYHHETGTPRTNDLRESKQA
jgi:ubiquinone/menaquinone biosynthesis C-methylase UbiE